MIDEKHFVEKRAARIVTNSSYDSSARALIKIVVSQRSGYSIGSKSLNLRKKAGEKFNDLLL